MTHEELIERCARAAAVKDSGPIGSQLFEIHWAEFGDGYLHTATDVLAEAYKALEEPNEEIHISFMEGYHRELANGRLKTNNENASACFAIAWKAAIDASPLSTAKEADHD